jgi:hypothetical protein
MRQRIAGGEGVGNLQEAEKDQQNNIGMEIMIAKIVIKISRVSLKIVFATFYQYILTLLPP